MKSKVVFYEAEQGTEEWFRHRMYKATASNFNRICTAKGAFSKQSLAYIDELILEAYQPMYMSMGGFEGNEDTRRGNAYEEVASSWFFNQCSDAVVGREASFATSEEFNHLVGCSADQLIYPSMVSSIGDYTGGLEIKCPKPEVLIKYLREGVLPDAYKAQVHGTMIVLGLKEYNFLAFNTFVQESDGVGLPHFCIKVEWDEYTETLNKALHSFIEEYDRALKNIKSNF